MALFHDIIVSLCILLLGGKIPNVLAYDIGNQLALIVGVVLIICTLMACLGAYSKRRNRN